MKKGYLILIFIGLILVSGCGKKIELKCESKDETLVAGTKTKVKTEILFDNNTKLFKSMTLKTSLNFNKKEEVEQFVNSKDVFCTFFTDEKQNCTFEQEGNKVNVEIKNITKNPAIEGKNKEEVKQILEKKLNKCQ